MDWKVKLRLPHIIFIVGMLDDHNHGRIIVFFLKSIKFDHPANATDLGGISKIGEKVVGGVDRCEPFKVEYYLGFTYFHILGYVTCDHPTHDSYYMVSF